MQNFDLRSDTVTRPSEKMKAFMFDAPVGDDIMGDDPTVKQLEKYCQDIFQMPEALFCPSGTMSNQIGLATLLGPMEEVIIEQNSHVYQYEVGGLSYHSRANIRLLEGKKGILTAEQIEKHLHPQDIHQTNQKVISLENTTNRGGGAYYSKENLEEIHLLAKKNNLSLHLDGARLFNAYVENGIQLPFYGEIFDSVSICLSKGLGAPVGSVLLLKDEASSFKARQMRKLLGGAMRQSGLLAAAGIFALENNIDDLKRDHEIASDLRKCLEQYSFVENINGDTNITIFNLDCNKITPSNFIKELNRFEIQAFSIGNDRVRFVTHRDLSPAITKQLSCALEAISEKIL